MEITKEIIDAINDMLEDDVLSLDEDGRIIDYRDVKVDIIDVERLKKYEDNLLKSILEKIRFDVGEAEYMMVDMPVFSDEDALDHWRIEGCCAYLNKGYTYLMTYDVVEDTWIVCGRMVFGNNMDTYERIQNLIHKFINSNLNVPFSNL